MKSMSASGGGERSDRSSKTMQAKSSAFDEDWRSDLNWHRSPGLVGVFRFAYNKNTFQIHMGVSLNGGTPKTPQNGHF